MSRIGENQTLYSKTSLETEGKLDRNIILSWLKDDITYVRQKVRQDNPGACVQRINLLRIAFYGYSIALQGLKDTELEDLARDIEEIKKKVGLKE